MASSGLENAATQRTSAQSTAFLANTLSKPTNINSGTLNSATMKSATLNKEGLTLARNMSDFSGPATSENRDRMGGSMRDSLDSSISAGAAKKIQEINKQKKKNEEDAAAKMLDSDGFEFTQMEADDFESLTLEEKILCGYYTAKPFMGEAYPITQMNIPNH